MINQSAVNNKSLQATGGDDAINLRALLVKYTDYWKLFLISFAVALVGVLIYKKYVQPTYDIVATLEIQDVTDKSPAETTSLVDFQQLDQVNAPRVVENEIEVLKSNLIIKQVVDHFQLWANYKLKGGFIKDQDLYGKSPVKINLLTHTTPIKPHKLKFQLVDANTYVLSGDDERDGKHRFGETITDKIGTWTVMPDSGLNKYLGSLVEIDVNDPDATVLSYQHMLNVEAEQKPATVINVSVNDKNIKRGQDFINYLVFYYRQNEVTEKNKIANATLRFIDDRLDSLSGQLNQSENKIEGYRSQNELTDVSAQSQMYLQQIQANSEKLNDINIQLNIINRLDDYLNQPSNSNANVPSTLGITDQHLVELVQKLSDVQLEKNRLLATLPEKNPAFEPLNNQITTLRSAIRDNIRSIKSNMLSTKNSLQGFKSNVQSSIKNVPVQEHQLAGMGRQQSTKETLYKYLLQQREQIALTYASSTSNVRLVDAAHILPLKASKRYIPYGIAFLFGLLFPVGFIYGKELVKNTVDNRKEIEHATGVPVLAEFSYLKLKTPIVFDEKDNKDSFILVEQFRNLRSRLVSLYPASTTGVAILVTSSSANEGKSFICSNLALSLANASKKVILLEMDIYKPNISKIFGLDNTIGLSNYFKEKATLQQIIKKSDKYPNLSFISSGEFIDDFSELLDREELKTMVEKLKLEYDYILLDTAPVHSISDALTLARYCDHTLYLTRYGQTSRSLLPFIHKLHTESLLPDMNILFNGLIGGRDSNGLRYENYYK